MKTRPPTVVLAASCFLVGFLTYYFLTRQPQSKPAPVPTLTAPAVVSPPSTSPPLPSLSDAKRKQLDELLKAYTKDEITPAEYFKRRREILFDSK